MALTQEQRERVDALIDGEYVDDEDDEKTEQAFENLMNEITDPQELHEFAGDFNWDCGCGEMVKVIAHPLCNLGTALLIYWRATPRWYLQYNDRSEVPDHERDSFDLIAEIEQKVIDGGFRTRSQPFDPRNDLGTDCTTSYEDVLENLRKRGKLPNRAIPPVMLQMIS